MRASAAILCVLASASCASPAANGDAGAVIDGDSEISCVSDPRADLYKTNMAKTGQQGVLSFVLVDSDPGPPARGTDTWRLQISDATGQPVSGATMTITPYMPDHGHGTSIVASATDDGGGSYALAPLYLFMPGIWQVTIDVTAGALTDTVVYTFCVQG